MDNLKKKLYYFFVEKNYKIKQDYEYYVDTHIDEHKKNKLKHWLVLLKLNFHYRILRSNKCLYLQNRAPKGNVNKTSKAVSEDRAYRLPELLTHGDNCKRYDIICLAFRPSDAKGGGGAVCNTLKNIFGDLYKGTRVKYFFNDNNITYPRHLEDAIRDYQWIVSVNFRAAYFVQQKLDLWSSCNGEKDVFFVCHDIGSAYGAYLCGRKYVLVYHQQGSLRNEAEGAGVELSGMEIDILNNLEETVMSNAATVYFPSNGAKNEYINTCGIDISKVNFGEPLYNTILEKPQNLNIDKVSSKYGISDLNKEDYQIFLTVGDYNENKGIDRVPLFLNEYVKRTNRKVFWIVAGNKHQSGVYERFLEEKDSWLFESIVLGKRIPHDEILCLMELCDFYIMLHRKSIFDLATLEAMRAGLVPILTDIGGNPEFNRKDNVILVDINDFEQAINEISATNIPEMSSKNKLVFNQYFSSNIFYQTYEKMFDYELNKLGAKVRFDSEVNKKNLSQFKNKFEGETVVICGGGSSLESYEPIPNAKHIALNRTLFCEKIKFDMLFMQDYPINDTEHSIVDYNQYPCDKFYGIITHYKHKGMGIKDKDIVNCKNNVYRYELAPIKFDRTIDSYEFEIDSYKIADACSVLFSALQFAVFAGFKKIYLVGVDFNDVNYDGKKNMSVYAKDVVANLLNFKSQIRLYDETVDLNVIETANPIIENGLGKYNDIITVTGVCSETYKPLCDLQKKSCLDNYRFDYQYFTDDEWANLGTKSSDDSFWGFLSGLSIRVQVTIDKIKKHWGGLLLLTDADLVFLKGTENVLKAQIKDNDMMFIKERADINNPYERAQMNINIGFVLMRCNEKSLKFWEEVKKRVEEKKGWDQEETNLILLENKDYIKWDFLSDEFLNGGDVNSSNVKKQYICTSCGTIAKRMKLEKDEYLKQILLMAKGRRNTWFDGTKISG